MSFLKPGTLCVTVGGSGENAGRIVEVLSYTGLHTLDLSITRGYRIRTLSGRPFAFVKYYSGPGTYCLARNMFADCTADRNNLRPLVDPKVEAEERDAVLAQ